MLSAAALSEMACIGTLSLVRFSRTLTTDATSVVDAATRYRPGSAMILTPLEGGNISSSMGAMASAISLKYMHWRSFSSSDRSSSDSLPSLSSISSSSSTATSSPSSMDGISAIAVGFRRCPANASAASSAVGSPNAYIKYANKSDSWISVNK